MQRGTSEPRKRRRAILVIATTVVVLVGVGTYFAVRSGDASDAGLRDRRATVEARGAHVMPFDQATTMHRFAKSPDGGIETVTANDPSDDTQVELIRMHLEHGSHAGG